MQAIPAIGSRIISIVLEAASGARYAGSGWSLFPRRLSAIADELHFGAGLTKHGVDRDAGTDAVIDLGLMGTPLTERLPLGLSPFQAPFPPLFALRGWIVRW
jgi:hypothetical protein